MKYKTELHCHSRDGSRCSNESAEGIVKKYLEHGYSTVVLTNHFIAPGNYDDRDEWLRQIDQKYIAYDKLVAAAEGKLNILMGLEFRFGENSNDYLVFGFTREYLENLNLDLMRYLGAFSNKAREDGLYVVQAHPFRYHMTLVNPVHVDAIEVYNGHRGHENHNFLAEAYARYHKKAMTSGTDHHDDCHMPRGGILTDEPITSMEQLIAVLKSGNYELIKTLPST